MRARHLVLIPLLTLLAACATDKYPMAPQFVSPETIAIDALGAPPAVGSAEYNDEITRIIARQKKLSDAQKAVLVEENHITPSMIIYPVLGKTYSEERYPALYTLLREAASDAWRISDAHEDFWNTPRPWYADDRVHLYVSRITRPGYPSGHTTTNTTWAYILSDLFPAKRAALFARASEIGYHRVDAGAHFPHDVEGGKRLAALIYARMKANPDYQASFSAARTELRAHRTPVKQGRVPRAVQPATATPTLLN